MTIDDTPILVHEHPECVVVNFMPETLLDPELISRVGKEIDELIDDLDPPNVVLAMPNVKQISSMMISVLLRTRERCDEAGGVAKLADLSRRVDDILDMAAIKPVFEVFESEEDARKSF